MITGLLPVHLWVPIETKILSSSLNSIDFRGLGEFGEYWVVSRFIADGNTEARIRFNDDTSSNYGYQIIRAVGFSTAGERQTSQTGILMGSANASRSSFSFVFIYANPNSIKLATSTAAQNMASGAVNHIEQISGVWNNAIDDVRSLSIVAVSGSFSSSSFFELWGRR